MNKRLGPFLHVAFWAFMFLSPLSFLRGQGMSVLHYLALCMTPLLMMVSFYANYLWLTPRLFVTGKHRYFLLINLVLILCLGAGLHYWTIYCHQWFNPQTNQYRPEPLAIEEVFFILRDTVTLGIFAAVGTAIVLAQRWEHNEKARRDAEAARIDAELKTLRNQINPHCLLNTLNNIYALTAFDTEKAQTAIQQLSKMLRHLLYDYEQPTVPLRDEVDFLQNYINLMKIRQSGKLDITFDVDVRCDGVKIVPLILIPLVENAFKHGISPTQPNFIHIRLYADCEQIDFSIDNSNHPKTGNDCSGHGIGLTQVTKRLEIAYAGRYAWQHGPSDDNAAYCSHINIKLAKA
jgi:two-component sensor histidine kinase